MLDKDNFTMLFLLLYLVSGYLYINYTDYNKLKSKVIRNMLKKYDNYIITMTIPIIFVLSYSVFFNNLYYSIAPIIYLHLLYFLIPKIFYYGHKYLKNKNILILYNIIVILICVFVFAVILK